MVRKVKNGVLKLTKMDLGTPYMVLKFGEEIGEYREFVNLGSAFRELLERGFCY